MKKPRHFFDKKRVNHASFSFCECRDCYVRKKVKVSDVIEHRLDVPGQEEQSESSEADNPPFSSYGEDEASGASPSPKASKTSRPTPTEARPLPDIRVKSDKVGIIAEAITNGGAGRLHHCPLTIR